MLHWKKRSGSLNIENLFPLRDDLGGDFFMENRAYLMKMNAVLSSLRILLEK
jgi:hypothetical protein